MTEQLLSGLGFFLVTTGFTIIGLPIASRVFSSRVLIVTGAKILGFILFGYIIWFLSSLHILNYQAQWFITGLYIASIALASWFIYKHKNAGSIKSIKRLLIVEGIGLTAFLGYLLIRSYNPDINGTERFMDMAFLSSAGKTDYFPFIDPWYAGKTVNYYYYGSYLFSLIANIARLPYALAYTFALGFIYSQALVLTAALIYALSKSKWVAGLGALVLTSAGTLFFANCYIQSIFKTPQNLCSYASSTRLYTPSYIINEIPSYSFTVGDLHAHLLALPFFILSLFLVYALITSDKPKVLLSVLLAASIATAGFINAWDLITLLCLGLLALAWHVYKNWRAMKKLWTPQVKSWLLFGLATFLLTYSLLWPGIRNFQNPVLGIGFAPSFVKLHNLQNVQWPTPVGAEIGMWGILFLGILLGYKYYQNKENAKYLALLILLSLGIIVGVEFLFIRDIYSIANPPFFRSNTTFKFGFHAWTMLCIACFALLGSLLKNAGAPRVPRAVALTTVAVMVFGGAVYPYAAIKQFYSNRAQPRALDGSVWMKTHMPGDYEAVQYINQRLKDRAVIAEAVGDSYTTYARINTFTGNIAPMGWPSHEWTWRFDGTLAKKAKPGQHVETGWGKVSLVKQDIQTLYETADVAVAQTIIKKYGIQYVYIGNLERTTYPELNEAKFSKLGTVVFTSANSRLYAIKSH